MTALHDIYELKHVFTDFDQKPMENVYYYRLENENPGGLPQSADLCNTWQADIMSVIVPTMPIPFVTQELRARNLFDPSDTYVKSLNVPGTRVSGGAELQPSFLSVICNASTTNGLIRKGRKMFAGLLESDQAAGILSMVGIPVFAIRAAAFAAYIGTLFGGAKKWAPVIVKRVREGAPGNYTYRLPENQTEALFGYIAAAVNSAIVSSQDTRKR